MYGLGYLPMRSGLSMAPYLEENKSRLLSSHRPIPKTATHNQLASYDIGREATTRNTSAVRRLPTIWLHKWSNINANIWPRQQILPPQIKSYH